ncbi:hypothetical protein [Streptomyces sp. CBMA156]|uniref:hypothetical protein n=1 Tax=Streptomyces sp. CBMA156 TaxID=1930280 RepID=UPI0016619490|nr:hypothetical protein [Streptomyces sp. CBMA156]MBD0670119.1 hypothetical protein [Streptomyces sp. CBMA156]
MFRDTRPRSIHIPTHRETADEWGEQIAALRAAPPGWFFLLGRLSSDGYLCHLDLNYHLDGELVAVVQTSRPVPPGHRVGSLTTPQSQLSTFLANSSRLDPRTQLAPLDGPPTPGEVLLHGVPVPVEVHRSHGCLSATVPRLPSQQGYVIVTATAAHWATATDLALRSPTAF